MAEGRKKKKKKKTVQKKGKGKKEKTRKEGKEKTEIQSESSLTGDENAAICTALYLYFTELHDEEKYAMTIHKVSKTYSPWSSKIYGVMNGIKN